MLNDNFGTSFFKKMHCFPKEAPFLLIFQQYSHCHFQWLINTWTLTRFNVATLQKKLGTFSCYRFIVHSPLFLKRQEFMKYFLVFIDSSFDVIQVDQVFDNIIDKQLHTFVRRKRLFEHGNSNGDEETGNRNDRQTPRV